MLYQGVTVSILDCVARKGVFVDTFKLIQSRRCQVPEDLEEEHSGWEEQLLSKSQGRNELDLFKVQMKSSSGWRHQVLRRMREQKREGDVNTNINPAYPEHC